MQSTNSGMMIWYKLQVMIITVFAMVSCEANQQSASELRYDFSDFDCSHLVDPKIKQDCHALESFKSLHRGQLRDGLGQEFDSYNQTYYDFFPSTPLGARDVDSVVASLAIDTEVVFSGDIHGNRFITDAHIRLLSGVVARFGQDNVACAIEMEHGSKAEVDQYRQGNLSENDMFRNVAETSAMPWKDWLEYYNACKAHNLDFFPVDVSQEMDPTMRQREEGIKDQILQVLDKNPGKTIFLPFGVLHLSGTDKLPSLLSEVGVKTFQFQAMAPAEFHWKCAEQLGSEALLANNVCMIDSDNAYLFSPPSLFQLVSELWSDELRYSNSRDL